MQAALQLMMSFMQGHTASPPQIRFPQQHEIDLRGMRRSSGERGSRDTAIMGHSDSRAESNANTCPSDAGGLLPGVLKPPALQSNPSQEQESSSRAMAKIRDDIKSAVGAQAKKTKKKKETMTKMHDEGTEEEGAESNDSSGQDIEDEGLSSKRRSKGEAPKANTTKAKAKSKSKAKSKAVNWKTDPEALRILRKPAANRPAYSEKPTHYMGGRIYYAGKSKNKFRVYLKSGDKVEKSVAIGESTRQNKDDAWQYSCALIEQASST